MRTDVNESREYEPTHTIHIGKLIEDELRRQDRTVTWLSRKIHCVLPDVYTTLALSYTHYIHPISSTHSPIYYNQAITILNNRL